jgi:hypothetical protein
VVLIINFLEAIAKYHYIMIIRENMVIFRKRYISK